MNRSLPHSKGPGERGFGLVYLAHEEQLARLVATTVPHARLICKPEDAEAYLAEARTVSTRDHCGIVPVHDLGSTEKYPCYVVSKYIEGTDLSRKIKESRLKYRDAAEFRHSNQGLHAVPCRVAGGQRVWQSVEGI